MGLHEKCTTYTCGCFSKKVEENAFGYVQKGIAIRQLFFIVHQARIVRFVIQAAKLHLRNRQYFITLKNCFQMQ